MQHLKVQWRGKVYEVPVCYDAAHCAGIEARWPAGVIDLLAMLAPDRSPSESMRQREWLAEMTLRIAGEMAPMTRPLGVLGSWPAHRDAHAEYTVWSQRSPIPE